MSLAIPKSNVKNAEWLPDMDLNHDKQIQSLLCYRYTIGQGNLVKLNHLKSESRICGSAANPIRPPLRPSCQGG